MPAPSKYSFNKSDNSSLIAVRVKDIILDDSHPEWKNKGEWASLGCIFYESVLYPRTNPSSQAYLSNFAYPLFPNIKQYPLLEEIVFLLFLPKFDNLSNPSNRIPYYMLPLNAWNSIHHNGIPSPFNYELPPSEQKSYEDTRLGNFKKTTDGVEDISLGKTFDEKANIKTLLPFEGDVIFEGRWGNSVRLGSTVNNSNISNNWSTSGNNGDSLIILRNGQSDDNGTEPWVPIVEDINKDKSSIYLTSTQKIPIKTETNYTSYTSEAPAAPNQYSGHQIILNSGRLVFNSTSDHILLSSNKTISFNALKGFNFDTNSNFVVNSKQIKLGSKNATEPLLLGNSTLESLNSIFTKLNELAVSLQVISTLLPSSGAIPIVAAAAALSTQMGIELKKYTGNNSPLKSKQNFTI
jgi:hypothetical protein